jgi:hypothetical protein
MSADLEVSGSLWVADTAGISSSRDVDVGLELRSGGKLAPRGGGVGLDAYVDGDVDANAPFAIEGELHVPTGSVVSADVSYASLVNEPVTVAPPCDCEQNQLLPVAAIVAARANNNDNALIGLDASALDNPGAPKRLDLECGVYYFDEIRGSNAITVVAHGPVAIYVGGEISLSAPMTFTLTSGGELDLFVAGRISNSQRLSFGSPAYPARMRVYSGSVQDALSLSSDLDVGAFLWAGHGRITTSGDIEAYGGIFTGDFAASGELLMHYDGAVLNAGRDCPDDIPVPPGADAGPPVDGGSPAVDAGVTPVDAGMTPVDAGGPPPAGQCETCVDCGNQACNDGVCGECATSADCCAPLLCIVGQCLLISG